MKKSVSDSHSQTDSHQFSNRVQRLYTKILYGLQNLQILFIPFETNSSLIVLFINNIRFHKQLSVANML